MNFIKKMNSIFKNAYLESKEDLTIFKEHYEKTRKFAWGLCDIISEIPIDIEVYEQIEALSNIFNANKD